MLKATCLPGVHYWGRPQLDRGIDFNGFLWCREGGNVLVDPMEVDEPELARIQELGGARWILLTNFDHMRAAAPLARLLEAEVHAPAEERERFGPDGAAVTGWFTTAADLPGDLPGSVEVHALRGGKSACETALWLAEPRALLFGDLVRSHESGRLRLLPPPKVSDPAAVKASLEPLLEHPADAILLGDGDSLFRGGREALAELVESL
jgi:glyoxylase-like metal-dependent hydrolase (beta-lactamase superfamily II)